MKIEAENRPKRVGNGTNIQFCVRIPPMPPATAIETAVIKVISKVDEFDVILRVIISLKVINSTAATAKREKLLKPEEPGLIIKSIPIKPQRMAKDRKNPKRSPRIIAPSSVTVNGKVCKIALALASGILNKALRNNKVAQTSNTLLSITRGQSFFSIDCLKALLLQQKNEIRITTKIPRIKITCNIGKLLAKYLISVSFET